MIDFAKKLIGNESSRRIKRYEKIVNQINSLEQDMQVLSDDELKNKTQTLKEALTNGASIEDLTAEAFALVREASVRVLNLRHFDVQLMGGLALLHNDIAEMATGEGKTLVASLPSYLKALEGKGVHVITVNTYLAERDRKLIGQVHEFLGLSVGLNINGLAPEQKRAAYQADITYGVGSEFGFDYLKDNMVKHPKERMRQRPYHYVIVDEIDSVLIDEAKTPLIIAGKTQVSKSLYKICAQVARSFTENEEYLYDRISRSVSFTEKGIQKVERAFAIDNIYDLQHQTLYHYNIQALRAHVMFKRDVDYIIDEDQIKLIDMYTGRVMEGRSLSDGLHQAIEAKEDIEITDENKTQATVTIQNFFRLYPEISGMTGTAQTERREFKQLYNLEVIQIPTNRPLIRQDKPDMVYLTKEQKYRAMTNKVIELNKQNQPVLVGTTSIIQSETVAEYLKEAGLSFELLNAKSIEKEVELISKAGHLGQITIATNMAGRGTDIQLGEGAAEAGGLFVLGTEKHESRRIDNQLRGRSGRQGDPGKSQFIISLEDDMMLRYGEEAMEKWYPTLKSDENGYVLGKEVHSYVEDIQRTSEDMHYTSREFMLKLDDVVNEQRDVLYRLRNNVLETDNPLDIVEDMIPEAVDYLIEQHCPDYQLPHEWSVDTLMQILPGIIPTIHQSLEIEKRDDKELIRDYVEEQLNFYMDLLKNLKNEQTIQERMRQALIHTIDQHWLDQLEGMTRLKEGISLRSYQQEDPLRIYLREGFELFEKAYFNIKQDTSLLMAKLFLHHNKRK